MPDRPNIVYLFADQLRARSLPLYGEKQIQTPHIDRLAATGVTMDHMLSTCPVCTPYRAMLLTGRYPQTTGHLVNFVRTRHDEIGLGDVFAHAGYRTAWIGKWHLHTGSFPQIEGQDFVPEGRDRLGFEHWRGYNFHTQYIDGWVNKGDWRCEKWKGYETDALNRYAFEFLDGVGDDPFCLFISPHQPHYTPFTFAPEKYYAQLPEKLTLPPNVPPSPAAPGKPRSGVEQAYRDYLAMSLAIDEMLGQLLDYLDRTGKRDNTLVIFTSDHGTEGGARGANPWQKMVPYEESVHVPMVLSHAGLLPAGVRNQTLLTPVDIMPTLCGFCGIPVPRTAEGLDLSGAILGRPGATERDAALLMNFTATHDYMLGGREWRGVRTHQHTFVRRLDGRTELYDLAADPYQMTNLAADPTAAPIRQKLEARLDQLMAEIGDRMLPAEDHNNWFDEQRRVVRNIHGPLGDPEAQPDFSLLG